DLAAPGQPVSAVVSQAILESWRLGPRAAVPLLLRFATDPDAVVRWRVIYTLGRARALPGVPVVFNALQDADPRVRAIAARGVNAVLTDSARLERRGVTARLQALLGDRDPQVRVNALRALATFRDSTLASAVASLASDADVNVAVQAETTLGAGGGRIAVEALRSRLASPVFALRRQAVIGLAQADTAAGAEAARALASDPDPLARASAAGRLAVATRFLGAVRRPDDYLVRRLAIADTFTDAAAVWGPDVPIATGRSDADYRDIVRRYLVPALTGQPDPQVTIETDRGRLTLELLPTEAPITVAAFLGLVDRHSFDGGRWHRVVPNFVIQDGDPRGDGWGGAGFVLRDEVNPEPYQAGTLGMALSGPDTGGSRFFITHSPQPHLDGIYTVFGQLTGDLRALSQVAMGDRIRSIHR